MVTKDDKGAKTRELILNGERRLKVLSATRVNAVSSPYIDNVLEYLRNNPDHYDEAAALIAAQDSTLKKIAAGIEYLKTLQ
jgi:hypothetical protein